jgi:hypothetical protein
MQQVLIPRTAYFNESWCSFCFLMTIKRIVSLKNNNTLENSSADHKDKISASSN